MIIQNGPCHTVRAKTNHTTLHSYQRGWWDTISIASPNKLHKRMSFRETEYKRSHPGKSQARMSTGKEGDGCLGED